jgi:hypothetical protein
MKKIKVDSFIRPGDIVEMINADGKSEFVILNICIRTKIHPLLRDIIIWVRVAKLRGKKREEFIECNLSSFKYIKKIGRIRISRKEKKFIIEGE